MAQIDHKLKLAPSQPFPLFSTKTVTGFLWHWRQMSLAGWLLRISALLVMGLMLLTPIYLIVRTFEAGPKAIDLFLHGRNFAIWGRTVGLCLSVTVGAAVISVPLAWLVEQTDVPGRRIWGTVAALPLVIPSYVYAYLFISMFGPKGTMQQFLEPWTGISSFPDVYGFWGAFIVLTLISYPYTYLSVRAGLQRIDPCLVEAARSLGTSGRRAFWKIVVPQLRPSIMAGSLLVALYTLRDFGAVTLLRYGTFTRAIYVQYQSFFDRSLAAALSIQLVVITAVILYLDWRTRGRARYERTSIGVARKARRTQLGIWRWPAVAFVASIVGVALLMPAGSLLYWLVRGLQQDTGVRALAGRANVIDTWSLWSPAANSLSAAALAALVTVLLAIPVAVLAVRHRGRLGQFVEQMTYAGFALPGIVIALAMVFFGVNYARPIYQTLFLMVIAYVILFVPQAVGAIRASLLQISPTVEEAGRSLGLRPFEVMRRVTLPLIRPGLLAGGALVFLTCMKELPATLILSPTGYDTLSVEVWSNISEAFFAQAALPTLLLLLLSSLPLAWLNHHK